MKNSNNCESSDWLDISVPICSGMVHWPGDAPVEIKRRREIARGDAYNLSTISMSAHTGTHLDAPLHFIAAGESVDSMPLDATIGRARVIESRDSESIKPEELARHDIRPGERILFKTRSSATAWKSDAFVEDYVYISEEAADFLAARGIRMVGIDYLSVARYKAGEEVHQKLLGAGIWVVEGLNLSAVEPGDYYLICLPLRLVGAEGAPARALLKPIR